jgi:hypothetical protein
MRRIGIAAIGLLIGGAFYLLLIDTRSLPELYALCGVALLAAIAFESSRELGFVEASFKARWLRHAWRPLVRVPLDIATVCREALAQLVQRKRTRGRFRAVRFSSDGNAADLSGRAALAEVLGSLAPNTIVIGVDSERELLLVHQLRREGGHEELDVLRLG